MADLTPITRKEKIIAGENIEPITREETFLKEYGGGGGGTVVEANPKGEAIENLNKLKISDTIYGIPQDSGVVELYKGKMTNTITLNDSMANYKFIVGIYLSGFGGNYELIGLWKYIEDAQYNDRRFTVRNPFSGTSGGFITYKVISETTMEYYDRGGISFTNEDLVFYGIK